VDPAAIRADENPVRNVDVHRALLAAVRALFVARDPHQIAQDLLLLLLNRRRHCSRRFAKSRIAFTIGRLFNLNASRLLNDVNTLSTDPELCNGFVDRDLGNISDILSYPRRTNNSFIYSSLCRGSSAVYCLCAQDL
jgi:hypothetical protein